MRSNKIHNVDLFTQAANEHFQKHIKTQSKQALMIIKGKVDWDKLLAPLKKKLAAEKAMRLTRTNSRYGRQYRRARPVSAACSPTAGFRRRNGKTANRRRR